MLLLWWCPAGVQRTLGTLPRSRRRRSSSSGWWAAASTWSARAGPDSDWCVCVKHNDGLMTHRQVFSAVGFSRDLSHTYTHTRTHTPTRNYFTDGPQHWNGRSLVISHNLLNNTHIHFTIIFDVVFVNQEKSFREGLFTRKSLSYLLVYLRMFHEWDSCEELQALWPAVTSREHPLLIISLHWIPEFIHPFLMVSQ